MVYFITYSKLPNNDASAVRIISLAKLFTACGYRTKLVGMGPTSYLQYKDHEGLCYTSLRINGNNLKTKLINFFGFKNRLKNIILNKKNLSEPIEAIVISALPLNALRYIKKIAKQINTKIFVDCCEWYSPEEFKLRKFDIRYILNVYFVQKYIDKSIYPIAISNYLEEYFRFKGYNTLRIPVIMDILNIPFSKHTDKEKFVFVYAGSPGTKDNLKVILLGISLLDKQEIEKIELRIFGITKKQLINKFEISEEIINKLGNSIKIFGRVSRQEVLNNLEKADFTVLMRSPILRYAKAGFPTKVVESLASATPVICNITSDLGDYICDDENGLVVKEFTPEAFSNTLKRALHLTTEQRKKMCESARKCAENFFDYRLYINEIDELING